MPTLYHCSHLVLQLFHDITHHPVVITGQHVFLSKLKVCIKVFGPASAQLLLSVEDDWFILKTKHRSIQMNFEVKEQQTCKWKHIFFIP